MLNITLKDGSETRIDIAKKGLSIRGFAKFINVSSGYLSEVLNGEREPSASFAHKVAQGLDKDMEDIFLIKVTASNDQKELK